jgi:hypothetical protein
MFLLHFLLPPVVSEQLLYELKPLNGHNERPTTFFYAGLTVHLELYEYYPTQCTVYLQFTELSHLYMFWAYQQPIISGKWYSCQQAWPADSQLTCRAIITERTEDRALHRVGYYSYYPPTTLLS